ncbi:rho GTPase-activating protein 20-like isoform X2 [Talpa occidentalis]|uniref:rho GTPase-activating protein 20-like isoform X1 n=1 Tax=Talpa occidentalis TaxID=50954 RepID=UPI0023F98863|nr:rho GTPase-activating protein 20-like isoform X1 [Talpa occidentalis]XP_054550496.1 rho GTPase-activating protein 20-like isoform X2 [Talpa occidentalis]XP_054550497.1 rho GTPase-activating protein 20-like isoform X2 [Talpa occidentalis]XP_054550498.1 rho GTPase-activating protein 20-like isoform X2 [Talpa occidentalis]
MFTSIQKRLKLFRGPSRHPQSRGHPGMLMQIQDEGDRSVNAKRTLLFHSPVEIQSQSGKRKHRWHLFLFNDVLLFSNTKYEKIFKIKKKVPLSTMWTCTCGDSAGHTRSLVLGWHHDCLVATFSSPQLKGRWHAFLQRYINLAKKKDKVKTAPLTIYTENIKNCAFFLPMIVSYKDTVNDVISMSLPMLGVTGSEKDYQLWVHAGKEEAPYPLAGSEYLLGNRQVPVTTLQPQRLEDILSPSTLEDQTSMGETQLVLKPRLLTPGKKEGNGTDLVQKTRIKKLSWAWWRRSRSGPESQGPPPSSTKSGQLFGVPLEDLCEKNELPPQIWDLLVHINDRGTQAEGIFKKTASMKFCQVLKEKLNRGEDVNLNNESVHVVASVLKDFLRNVPGGVFPSGLYEEWLGVTDQGKQEEKITATQRLVDQLPGAHIILLRHLFGVLYNMKLHSSVTQMTAYNLAVCVAPSLFCPPTSGCPELVDAFRKKVCFIQHILENCQIIFGQDIMCLFGETSKGDDSSKSAEGTGISEWLWWERQHVASGHGSRCPGARAQPKDSDFHVLLLLEAAHRSGVGSHCPETRGRSRPGL